MPRVESSSLIAVPDAGPPSVPTGSSLTLAIPRRAGWEPGFIRLCAYLTQQTGRPIRLSIVRDFDEVRDLVMSSKVDFGILTSTGYVQVKRLSPGVQYLATAIASEGGGPPTSSYGGAIVVRRDSGIVGLNELQGKPFAFVSTASSSGFKYPVVALERKGVDYKLFFGNLMFMGDHPFVTDAVAAGIATGGATWEGNLAKAKSKHGDIFLELEAFGPIVNHAFVAARTVNAEISRSVAAALLTLTSQVIGADGFPYVGFETLPDGAYSEAAEVERLERRLSGPSSVRRSVPGGEFRTQVLTGSLGLLREIRIVLDQKQGGGRFVKREPTPLLSERPLRELAAEVVSQSADLARMFPAEAGTLPANIGPRVMAIADDRTAPADAVEHARQLLLSLAAILPASEEAPPPELFVSADGPDVMVDASTESLEQQPSLTRALGADLEAQRAISATSALLERRRRDNSALSAQARRGQPLEERLALQVVYALVGRGAVVRGPYQPLGISGFREIHSYLFNTDPGEGHITVSCADLALMRGTAVHVEHIDRDKEFNKEKVEAYRLPAAINAARVRLHVGSDAPTTAFIGRPVFESGTFRLDLLKSVHMTASACTAMFMNGIADCKIAIERMTAVESVEFMRAVVANVIRDRTKQYLSAAFNINTPFIDDRPATLRYTGGQPNRLTDRMDVARLGISIARQAGFDKVTWDGASNEVPSRPIIGLFDRPDRPGQLSHAQVCHLVHEAHEHGLNAYVSAGLDPAHMRDAVLAGLDGVGIGTSLHFIDPDTKLMGALRADKIAEALRARDDAEQSLMGRAAVLLARADRMYFEGTLPARMDPERQALFGAVVARDMKASADLIERLRDIAELPLDGKQSVLDHARRVVHAAETDSLLHDRLSSADVRNLVGDVRHLMEAGDLPRLVEVLTIPSAVPHAT